MPILEKQMRVELTARFKAFLNLQAGVVRGAIPDPGGRYREKLAQAQARASRLEKRLQKARGKQADRSAPGGRAAPAQKTHPAGGDPRDALISEVVAGKTFADLGGLGSGWNEKLSVADGHGATSVAMIDVVPEGHGLWTMLDERMAGKQVENHRKISADIMQLAEKQDHPRFQVVHCTGVLYHMPEPLSLLKALYKITDETLILGSAIAPPRIEGAKDAMEIPEASALFVPALKGRERRICEEYWKKVAGDQALGLTTRIERWDVKDFAPWWYLPTVEAMESLCEAVGFTVEKGFHYWGGNAYVALLSKRK